MESVSHASGNGCLTLVSVPIGNPQDITRRALLALRSAALVVAEDGVRASRLLAEHGIDTPVTSCRPRRSGAAMPQMLQALEVGKSVAFVSDAGTPCIADPGILFARAAVAAGHTVTACPGPSALLCAIAVSGLDVSRFTFLGFAPRSRTDRDAFFADLSMYRHAMVLYESGAYLKSTLRQIQHVLDDAREAALCVELTTAKETIHRGTIGSLASKMATISTRGQIVLVVGPI